LDQARSLTLAKNITASRRLELTEYPAAARDRLALLASSMAAPAALLSLPVRRLAVATGRFAMFA
jgi:hypothetical protein